MEIQPISSLMPASSADASGSSTQTPAQDGISSFKDLLDQALQGVDALQKDAQQQAGAVATGDASSFHDAIIASEKALLAFQLTAQIQNKVIGAYNQVMQMQM
jgi:flagellar hook-basal body complex protein FliE